MARILENANSILAGNLNSDRSHRITAIIAAGTHQKPAPLNKLLICTIPSAISVEAVEPPTYAVITAISTVSHCFRHRWILGGFN